MAADWLELLSKKKKQCLRPYTYESKSGDKQAYIHGFTNYVLPYQSTQIKASLPYVGVRASIQIRTRITFLLPHESRPG